MVETTPPRRRWFQFGLRTMFVAVTIVAIFVGYHVNWIQARREAIRSGIAVQHTFAANQIVPRPPFALRLLGERGEEHLFVAPTQFERVCKLFPEAEVLEYVAGSGGRSRPMTIGSSREISKALPTSTSTSLRAIPKE